MVIDKQAFRSFVNQHGSKFPYNEIKRTRNSFYPKWLLLKSENPFVTFRYRGYFVLRSSCLPSDIIQEIVVTKSGLPLPPDYCDVIDCLDGWCVNERWEQDVLGLFDSYLDPENYNESPTKEELFYNCLCLLVERKARDAFVPSHGHLVAETMQEWQIFYHFWYAHRSKNFLDLARQTIYFVDDGIANRVRTLQQPIVAPVTSEVD